MAVKHFRKRTLFAAQEDEYGVAETLATTDAIRTRNLAFDDQYGGERITRNLDRPNLGLEAEINIQPNAMISFECELKGSGTAGVAPRIGRLLRASGDTETFDNETAPTYVEYEDTDEMTDSVTLGFEMDGRLQILAGARGTRSEFWEKGIPYVKFTFTGFYQRATKDTIGTPDFGSEPSPVPVTKANTTLMIDSFSCVATSFSIDRALQVVPRNVIGQEEILLTDRQPTGQMVINEPDIDDDLDLFADYIESHEELNYAAIELVHNDVAGNIVEFANPQVQLSSAKETDDNGIAMYTIATRFIGASKLTFK